MRRLRTTCPPFLYFLLLADLQNIFLYHKIKGAEIWPSFMLRGHRVWSGHCGKKNECVVNLKICYSWWKTAVAEGEVYIVCCLDIVSDFCCRHFRYYTQHLK